MKILQVVDSLNEGTGGTSYSVSELSDALVQSASEVRLVSQDYSSMGPVVHPQFADARIVKANPLPFRLGSISSALRDEIQHGAEWASIVHSNGMWLPVNLLTRNAAVRRHKPLVISTRGMFENWSRRHKAFRKRIAWCLFEEQNLKSATCLHATSEEEAVTLRSQLRNPIAVIPNGVCLPDPTAPISREKLEERFPALRNRRWLLFLSRLHPKKGLPELLESWNVLQKEYADWHLLIAGGDEDNHRNKLEEMVLSHELQKRVTFAGNLSGDLKSAAFANADFFVLPSHSENFGRVIAEALSYSVPVITTKQTPWSLLQTESCGWWINDDRQDLESTLRTTLHMDKSSLREMGERGRRVVAQRFAWSAIARQFETVYQWLLNMDSPPPDCMRMA